MLYLLYIGLIVTPFLTMPDQANARYLKSNFALGVALFVFLSAVYRSHFKPLENKWLICFVGWVCMISLFAPVFHGLILGGGNADGLWNMRTCFYIVVYFGALWAISSDCYSGKQLTGLLSAMATAGSVMALYAILQKIGIDPLFHVKQLENQGLPDAPAMVGTLGHPTFVSCYIVMCLAPALYLKRRFSALLMLIAIFLTKSVAAYAGVLAVIVFYALADNKSAFYCACVILAFSAFVALEQGFISDSGRLNLWIQIIEDMKHNPRTFLTGFGIGSFEFIYPIMHPESLINWVQAHNEYMEVLWGTGIAGIFFMVKSFIFTFQNAMASSYNPMVKALGSSLFGVVVCAGGNFVWHMGVFTLYTVIIWGLLNSVMQNSNRRIQ